MGRSGRQKGSEEWEECDWDVRDSGSDPGAGLPCVFVSLPAPGAWASTFKPGSLVCGPWPAPLCKPVAAAGKAGWGGPVGTGGGRCPLASASGTGSAASGPGVCSSAGPRTATGGMGRAMSHGDALGSCEGLIPGTCSRPCCAGCAGRSTWEAGCTRPPGASRPCCATARAGPTVARAGGSCGSVSGSAAATPPPVPSAACRSASRASCCGCWVGPAVSLPCVCHSCCGPREARACAPGEAPCAAPNPATKLPWPCS